MRYWITKTYPINGTPFRFYIEVEADSAMLALANVERGPMSVKGLSSGDIQAELEDTTFLVERRNLPPVFQEPYSVRTIKDTRPMPKQLRFL